MTIAVRELTSAEAVFASHRALRAKFYPAVVAAPPPPPQPKPVYVVVNPSKTAQATKRWCNRDVERLRELAADGQTALKISTDLQRSKSAIQWKAGCLGIKLVSEQAAATRSMRRMAAEMSDIYRLSCSTPPRKTRAADEAPRAWARALVRDLAAERGFSVAEMTGGSRTRPVAWARQHAIWLIARETGLSLAQIGLIFNRDHTTILHSIRAENLRQGASVRQAQP